MTAVICLGGPLHGRFVDPGPGGHVYASMPDRALMREYRKLVAERDALIEQGADPDELIEPLYPKPRTVTYHQRSIQIVGWRLVLNCLTTWDIFGTAPDGCVMPGYVHGVPAECEPDRNARKPVCTCPLVDLAAALRQVTHRGVSSCHLDYCSVHGPFRDKTQEREKDDHGR